MSNSASNRIDISIVIPAKDEESRLPQFLSALAAYCLQNNSLSYEVIVVDDGSRDKTAGKAMSFKERLPNIRVISQGRNQGKGFAVKTGCLAARGNAVLFMDADGSTPPDEIKNALVFLGAGYDIVIGSRAMAGTLDKIQARFYRRFMGRLFHFFVSGFLFRNVQDTQCGFKVFKREVVEQLFSKITIKGFGFDLELLYLAFRMGLSVKEMPVRWEHRTGSKINLFTDSLGMLLDIFRIRIRHQSIDNVKSQNVPMSAAH